MSRIVPVLIAAALFFAPVLTPIDSSAPVPSQGHGVAEFPRAETIAQSAEPDGKKQKGTAEKTVSKMIAAPVVHAASVSSVPKRLHIPSINLNSPIIPLGVNSKGEMDVPSGNTNNVGWYKDGTVPGNVGSAVLDAHVYAAFKNLHELAVGSDIYVTDGGGKTLRFRITEMKTYALADVPLQKLFNRANAVRLNLITCAGTFLPAQDTYSHRLIVYAELVN